MAPKYFILMLLLHQAFSFTYPYYTGGRSYPMVPTRRQFQSPYLPIPENSRVADYPAADYDDTYIPSEPADFDYYDKYDPYVKYARGSYSPYYRPRDFYMETMPRKDWDRMSYYEEPVLQDPTDEEVDGMYGDGSWYDDAANAEANRAFVRNLMLARMYEDANPSSAYRYDMGDYDSNGRKYEYGIPTNNPAERERVRKFFQENANRALQQLQALVRKQIELEELKTTDEPMNVDDITDIPEKSKERTGDAKNYFNMQKQLILNSRKSNKGQVAEGLKLEKKRTYDPLDDSKFFDLEPFDETTTNSIKKLNVVKGKDMMKEMPSTLTTMPEPATTATPQKIGQKEVVLPRPSSPARKPYPEVSTRSMNPPSVYDTIKKLLDMEKEAETKTKAQPQKRFATDDPLEAELNELKKSTKA